MTTDSRNIFCFLSWVFYRLIAQAEFDACKHTTESNFPIIYKDYVENNNSKIVIQII